MRSIIHSGAAVVLLASASASGAEEPATYQFDIPASDLSAALRRVAVQSGLDLIVPADAVAGRQAHALQGWFTADRAIAALLEGTGLEFTRSGNAIVVRQGLAAGNRPDGEARADIVVTGTRIRGAPIAAPVIRLTSDEMRNRGEATLAEAVRTIPQNFGGGQNPGIGNNVPAANGVNVGSATSVNLRGLGSDATLTLIDGHRISYSASRQAIDISAIPLPAVDRIEVVPDGASALYGSDAVAGVVNVVLKRDYDGVEAGARLGVTADGGGSEQRFDLAAGRRWAGGGLIATYEYGKVEAIRGRDRSYSAAKSPALTLVPSLRNHSATLSAHQDLGSNASAELDAFLNDRKSLISYALNSAGDIAASGARLDYDERSFALAPTLRWRPAGSWNLFLTGSYARDHTHYEVRSFFSGQVTAFPGNCYCNHAASAEAGGDGTLAELPGGPVKLAAGAGYRTNKLVRFNGEGASTNVSKGQQSHYLYGELSLPLVSPAMGVRLVRRLSASAAARYERYPGIGSVVTPKLAAIYAPSQDIDLKASWGKSYRAPTLYQQYQAVAAVLAPAAAFGGSGFPAGSTALLVQGGSPDLKPERATSLSATAALHPRAIAGANLELSYFRVRYKDRVVTPIAFLSQSLSNPIYADRLTFAPSPQLQAAVIASAVSFANATGAAYSPANVAVLIDDRNVNAGFQKLEGADLLLDWRRALTHGLGEVSFQLDAAYLESEQQLDPLQPVVPLAGLIFNPPHWSARGDLGWSKGPLTMDLALTHVGKVEDRRRSTVVTVDGMTTVDLSARVRSDAESGFLRGLDASVSIHNLLDAKPARIATSLPSDAPYDSTNYSPVGRFVTLSLLKRW